MITDALLTLSSAQAVTASAVSTNTIDLSGSRDMAQGGNLYAVFGVDEAATAAGAATVTFQVITSANANLSSPSVLASTDAIPKADLTLGRRPINLRVNSSVLAAQNLGNRYLGVQYVVATGPLVSGKFSCNLATSVTDLPRSFGSGFTAA